MYINIQGQERRRFNTKPMNTRYKLQGISLYIYITYSYTLYGENMQPKLKVLLMPVVFLHSIFTSRNSIVLSNFKVFFPVTAPLQI